MHPSERVNPTCNFMLTRRKTPSTSQHLSVILQYIFSVIWCNSITELVVF